MKPYVGQQEVFVACKIPKRKVFKFKVTEKIQYSLYLTNPLKFIFEPENGIYRMQIDRNDPRSQIFKLNKEIKYKTKSSDPLIVYPGRKNWTTISTGFISRAVFSACANDEYSCSSGHCIDFSKICNYESNCEDDSDEQYCEYTKKPQDHYDKRLSPAPDKNNPAPFDLKLMIERVNKIDMEDSIMQFTFTMIATWKDNRLSFNNLLEYPEPSLIPNEIAEAFWHPQISFTSAKTESRTIFHLDKNPGKFFALPKSFGKIAFKEGFESKLMDK